MQKCSPSIICVVRKNWSSGQYGEYLLYSERERDRKAINPAAKREGKKRKLIAKEKQNAQEFEAALGRMGLDFEGSVRAAEPLPGEIV